MSKKDDLESVPMTPPTISVEQEASLHSLPNIVGINPLGDSVRIRDIKSKYILLEFWASWCPPCRQLNPALVKVYNKYKTNGFEIFSISLDDDDTKWKNAIAKDNLHWTYHICEFKGWQSYWAAKYKIEFIPNNILFDEKGNIVAKELEPSQLDKILVELLTK